MEAASYQVFQSLLTNSLGLEIALKRELRQTCRIARRYVQLSMLRIRLCTSEDVNLAVNLIKSSSQVRPVKALHVIIDDEVVETEMSAAPPSVWCTTIMSAVSALSDLHFEISYYTDSDTEDPKYANYFDRLETTTALALTSVKIQDWDSPTVVQMRMASMRSMKIKSLDVSIAWSLSSFRALAEVHTTTLVELRLEYNEDLLGAYKCLEYGDMRVLGGLTNLMKLSIVNFGYQVIDLAWIGKLYKLQHLCLQKVFEFNSKELDLKSLTDLRSLCVIDSSVHSWINCVRDKVRLQRLEVAGCDDPSMNEEVHSTGPLLLDGSFDDLKGLAELRYVHLSYVLLRERQLNDLRQLYSLLQLEVLDLRNCRMIRNDNGQTDVNIKPFNQYGIQISESLIRRF